MQNIQIFKEYLSQPLKMVILTHFNPDADALGSSLGLVKVSEEKRPFGCDYRAKRIPGLYWLDALTRTKSLFSKKKRLKRALNSSRKQIRCFCLDFSSLNRINELGEMVRKSCRKKGAH